MDLDEYPQWNLYVFLDLPCLQEAGSIDHRTHFIQLRQIVQCLSVPHDRKYQAFN